MCRDSQKLEGPFWGGAYNEAYTWLKEGPWSSPPIYGNPHIMKGKAGERALADVHFVKDYNPKLGVYVGIYADRGG